MRCCKYKTSILHHFQNLLVNSLSLIFIIRFWSPIFRIDILKLKSKFCRCVYQWISLMRIFRWLRRGNLSTINLGISLFDYSLFLLFICWMTDFFFFLKSHLFFNFVFLSLSQFWFHTILFLRWNNIRGLRK